MNLRRSAIGIADQAVLSAAAFSTHIVLAVVLPLSEYGKFAVGYAGLAMLLAVHQATVQQPMVVLSAGRHAAHASGVANHFLAIHVNYWMGGLIALALLSLASRNLGSATQLDWAFVSITLIASSSFLLMHLLRRVWHVTGRVWISFAGNGLYLFTVTAILLALMRNELVSAFSAMLGILIASVAVCSFWLLCYLPRRSGPIEEGRRREVSAATRMYSKWALPSQASLWLMDNGPYLIVGFTGGLASVGALRAVGNFVLPFLHVVVGVANLLLVASAQAAARGPAALRREFGRSVFVLSLLSVAFSIALFLMPSIAARLQLSLPFDVTLLYLSMALPLLWSIQGAGITFLRSMEQPRKVLFATLTAVVVGLPVIVSLTAVWQAVGAMVGWVTMTLISAALVTTILLREISVQEKVPADALRSPEGLDLG